MKCTINVKQMQKILKSANALQKATTLPILECVKIEVSEDKKMKVYATNLEQSLLKTEEIEAVEEAGVIALPVKRLFSLLKSYKAETLTITSDEESNVILKCGRSRVKLATQEVADFPNHPEVKKKLSFKFDGKDFSNSLSKCAFAVSTDQSRMILTGIHLELSDDQLNVVGTDGKRMSLVELDVSEIDDAEGILQEKDSLSFDLPVDAVLSMANFIDGEIEIIFDDEKKVMFKNESTEVISSLLQGTYPNYRQVIPTNKDVSVEIDAFDLKEIVERAVIILDDDISGVVMNVTKKDLSLIAKGNSGNVDENIEVTVLDEMNEEFQRQFNPSFILEFLKSTNSMKVNLIFCKNSQVVVFDDREGLTHIIMPLNR